MYVVSFILSMMVLMIYESREGAAQGLVMILWMFVLFVTVPRWIVFGVSSSCLKNRKLKN